VGWASNQRRDIGGTRAQHPRSKREKQIDLTTHKPKTRKHKGGWGDALTHLHPVLLQFAREEAAVVICVPGKGGEGALLLFFFLFFVIFFFFSFFFFFFFRFSFAIFV
jgi:hypothetical protein